MGSRPADFSLFDGVDYVPPDAIFELTKLYNADTSTRRVNLGQGTYKDEHGNPWILPSVREAKEKTRDANHEYLPILGLELFRNLAARRVYGEKSRHVLEDRVASCQALSGTGGLHLAGLLLAHVMSPEIPVYITQPTWNNHWQVFEAVGFSIREFQWYNPKTGHLDMPSILRALREAPSRSIFVFHACAHNPSGCDPSHEEWREIGAVVKERQLFPLFDAAYLGITSGSYEQDAFAIRYFVDELDLETAVCASFAKNMGLYGERVGHVSIVAKSASAARTVQSRLAMLTRCEISNPPAFGARIAAAIMGDPELQAQWDRDLVTMSSRIGQMRTALYETLTKLGTPGNWGPILQQKGMFCILGLSREQVLELREGHHVYMADSSRISIAGLNTGNVEYVAAAIDTVVRG